MARILAALALFIALLPGGTAHANPCALQDGSGMGGTGHAMEGSGMGGTGLVTGVGVEGSGGPAEESGMGGTGNAADGSGMGGTGRRAESQGIGGTGVVGIITGFASICVNGVEIHYDAATPVSIDGQAADAGQLAVGQLVSVEASGQGDDLRARRIALVSALVGPVTWVAPDGDTFMAMGQTVRLASSGKAEGFRPKAGDMVRVNGLRDAAGVVHATRVNSAKPGALTSVTGRLDYVSGGRGRIAGLVVLGLDADLAAGDPVRVAGNMRDGVLRVRTIERTPEIKFAPGVDRLVLQGVVHGTGRAGELSLGYVKVKTLPGAAPRAGQWVRVEARRAGDGSLQAGRVIIDRTGNDGKTESHGKSVTPRKAKSADENDPELNDAAAKAGAAARGGEDDDRAESGTGSGGKAEPAMNSEKARKTE
ncbi:MAG: hypothetical protein KBF24_10675, partial [Thiobacillaceae bacterium]|nr:hypothetical protein [Thiobacillaceae bacterium]